MCRLLAPWLLHDKCLSGVIHFDISSATPLVQHAAVDPSRDALAAILFAHAVAASAGSQILLLPSCLSQWCSCPNGARVAEAQLAQSECSMSPPLRQRCQVGSAMHNSRSGPAVGRLQAVRCWRVWRVWRPRGAKVERLHESERADALWHAAGWRAAGTKKVLKNQCSTRPSCSLATRFFSSTAPADKNVKKLRS